MITVRKEKPLSVCFSKEVILLMSVVFYKVSEIFRFRSLRFCHSYFTFRVFFPFPPTKNPGSLSGQDVLIAFYHVFTSGTRSTRLTGFCLKR